MDDSEIDIRSILGLLRRQFRLILITIALVLTVAGIYAYSLPSIYSASALVLVDPQAENLLSSDSGGSSKLVDTARVDSEVEILRSDSILLKVIETENLVADAQIGASMGLVQRLLTFFRLSEPTLPTAEDALNQVVTQLRGAVSIQRRGFTNLIAIQVSSRDRATAARLANTVATVYVQDQLDAKIGNVLSVRNILQARVESARNSVITSENAFDAFISANIDSIAKDSGRSDLASMQAQIQTLSQARAQTVSTVDLVQAGLASEDWQTVVANLQSDALVELERQRAELAGRLASESGSATEADLRAQLASIEDSLRNAAGQEVATLRTSIADTQSQEEALRLQLRNQVVSSALSPDALARLYELQQGATLARSEYQALLARSQELDTQAQLQVADSRIVSPALAPQSPSSPNVRVILIIAGILALAIGIALAFVYENYIGGFTTEDQAESVLKARVAAAVPRMKAGTGKSLADLMLTAPLSTFAESIRRLRATIDQMHRGSSEARGESDSHVIMISSASPDEGKSTVGLALARSYALSGRKTVLIDCDLRKPAIHQHLGLERSHGLYDFLMAKSASNAELQAIVSSDPLSGAVVIIGARNSTTPTDQLLSNASFSRLIDAARSTFEVVILDSPPIGPVVDGLYIAPFADTIVFVTRWAHTSQLEARKSVASLMAVKQPKANLVALLNQRDEPTNSAAMKYAAYYRNA